MSSYICIFIYMIVCMYAIYIYTYMYILICILSGAGRERETLLSGKNRFLIVSFKHELFPELNS